MKKTILSINSLNKLFSNRLFRIAAESELGVVRTDVIPSGRVLILAPHPDDEVFGCAGAIYKHIKQKDVVKIVFCSDGSLGFQEGFRPSVQEKKEMVVTRESEARAAAASMGVTDLVFLKYKDGELSANRNNISFMTQLINEYRPDIIYAPAVNDPNPDHRETIKLLAKSIVDIDDRVQIFQFEVWSPIYANFILSIDDFVEAKKKTIVLYKSQLKSRDYLGAILGLNSYRGLISGTSKYAEAYFRSNKKFFDEYYKLDSK